MPVRFRCTVAWSNTGAAWLHASGELDIAVAQELDATLREALDGFRLVVLDLDALTFIDVAGVSAIVDASVGAACAGQRLLVASPPAHVRRLVRCSGSEDLVEVLDMPTPDDPRKRR